MPVSYRLDRDAGRIETIATGELRLHEVLSHFRELAAESSLPEPLEVLLDVRGTTTLPNSAQLREVVRTMENLPALRFGACAVVADRDVLYGMLRVFEALAEQLFTRVRVFRDRETALRWLDEPPPEH